MRSNEFSEKVYKKEIKNGTIFDVLIQNKKIGQVAVVRDSIVYFDFENNVVPQDLLIGDYIFEEIEEE